MQKALLRLVLPVLILSLCACGYHFSGGARPGDPVRTVFIPVLDNETAETGLETMITNGLIREFTREQKFTLAHSRAEANVLLAGSIESLLDENAARRSSGDSALRRVRMILSLELLDEDGRVLWADDKISEHETYQVVSGNLAATQANKNQALSVLTTRLAMKIRHRMEAYFEGF
ncbi:Lipopolysaccharide-assembly [Desulfatibacillum alkenivorans DSM 16219]|jgi:outer membrane lipopolysaccharide assembly protein LptE/RlpB|uniref:Lipopolysaccharide-assembly n=1 Tax=Desulfatibacillum alkenivorans DSM 16219 TaxID=1121393 RepID=A0A1M6PPP7_9BACT|nr:LPS assembly lipoprotein LptE [Desulfatibacillum alkenivorans]SHK09923.1 Lipopolysaccharide-assembly [Desulfatibacillum alkenivorans DSM 16219]